MRQPYQEYDGGVYYYHNMTYLLFTFDLFNHLCIEPSAMGAWQAYLLCISKTLLPFSDFLYYTKRKLILSNEQLRLIRTFPQIKGIPELMNLNKDVSPSVQINDKQAVVSCCYWNSWHGLIREEATISFLNGRVYFLSDFHDEILFKHNCGIRF